MRNPRHAFRAAGTTPTCTWGSNPLHGNKIHPMLALLALNHSIAYPSHSYLLHALCTPTPVWPSQLQPYTKGRHSYPLHELCTPILYMPSTLQYRTCPPTYKVGTTSPCMHSTLQPHACTPHANPVDALQNSSDLTQPHPTSSEVFRHHPTSSDLIRSPPTSSDLV